MFLHQDCFLQFLCGTFVFMGSGCCNITPGTGVQRALARLAGHFLLGCIPPITGLHLQGLINPLTPTYHHVPGFQQGNSRERHPFRPLLSMSQRPTFLLWQALWPQSLPVIKAIKHSEASVHSRGQLTLLLDGPFAALADLLPSSH